MTKKVPAVAGRLLFQMCCKFLIQSCIVAICNEKQKSRFHNNKHLFRLSSSETVCKMVKETRYGQTEGKEGSDNSTPEVIRLKGTGLSQWETWLGLPEKQFLLQISADCCRSNGHVCWRRRMMACQQGGGIPVWGLVRSLWSLLTSSLGHGGIRHQISNGMCSTFTPFFRSRRETLNQVLRCRIAAVKGADKSEGGDTWGGDMSVADKAEGAASKWGDSSRGRHPMPRGDPDSCRHHKTLHTIFPGGGHKKSPSCCVIVDHCPHPAQKGNFRGKVLPVSGSFVILVRTKSGMSQVLLSNVHIFVPFVQTPKFLACFSLQASLLVNFVSPKLCSQVPVFCEIPKPRDLGTRSQKHCEI